MSLGGQLLGFSECWVEEGGCARARVCVWNTSNRGLKSMPGTSLGCSFHTAWGMAVEMARAACMHACMRACVCLCVCRRGGSGGGNRERWRPEIKNKHGHQGV